jgi:hypothetical protein
MPEEKIIPAESNIVTARRIERICILLGLPASMLLHPKRALRQAGGGGGEFIRKNAYGQSEARNVFPGL